VGKYGSTKQATGDNTRRKRVAYWITKATDTNSEYVKLIVFPREQWLRKSTSMLCYTYIVCLVCSISTSSWCCIKCLLVL